MKNKLSGYIDKTIAGKKIGFKFGTNAFALLSQMHDVELEDIDKVMSSAMGVRDLIYCAAKANALSKGKEIDFNQYTVGDWLDDMEQEDYDDILGALASAKVMGKSLNVESKKK